MTGLVYDFHCHLACYLITATISLCFPLYYGWRIRQRRAFVLRDYIWIPSLFAFGLFLMSLEHLPRLINEYHALCGISPEDSFFSASLINSVLGIASVPFFLIVFFDEKRRWNQRRGR